MIEAPLKARIPKNLLYKIGDEYTGSEETSDSELLNSQKGKYKNGRIHECRDGALRWWTASAGNRAVLQNVSFWALLFSSFGLVLIVAGSYNAIFRYIGGGIFLLGQIAFITSAGSLRASGRSDNSFGESRLCYEIKNDIITSYYFERPYVDDLAPFFLGMYDPEDLSFWTDSSRPLYEKKDAKEHRDSGCCSGMPEIKKMDLRKLKTVSSRGSNEYELCDDCGNYLAVASGYDDRPLVEVVLQSYVLENGGTYEINSAAAVFPAFGRPSGQPEGRKENTHSGVQRI